MTKPVLICGSVAFDTIAVFDGRFKDHILPDRIHALSVSFLVPRMRREFGGCAGNIAYKLMQELGGAEAIGPVLMGLNKPVHVLQLGSSVREIVNMITLAVVDAQNKR